MLPSPCEQLRQRHDPGLTRKLPTLVEKHQCRYASDGKALRQVRHCVAVHLDQPHFRLELGCRLLKDRSHHSTRATPSRPEIDEERNVIARRMSVEAASTAQRNRSPFKQRTMAGSAL